MKWLTATALAVLLLAQAPGGGARAQDTDLQAYLERLNIVTEGGRRLVEVSLKDVLAIALERSTLVKASRIGERVALRALAASRFRNNPTLTSSATLGRVVSPTSSTGSTNFLTLATISSTTLSAQYEKKLDSGIKWSVKYSEVMAATTIQTVAAAGDTPSDAGTSSRNQSAVTASVTVPFFQDYGKELGNLPERRGQLGVQRSGHLTRQQSLGVLRAIALVYWDMVTVLENIRVQEESVKLSERLLKDNQERLEAGVLSPADVKASETQLARDRQDLLQFQLAALRAEDQARAALNLENLEMGFKPIDVPKVRETKLDFAELREKTFQNNPSLRLARAALADNGFRLLEARNEGKTDLDLTAFYTLNGYQANPFAGITGFGQTAIDAYGATLTWTLPLWDNQAEETLQQRLLERSQLELQRRDLKTTLSIRLQSELRSLRLAKKEVETARVSVSLAGDLLQNEIERFKLGRSTSFQVAQLQRDAAQARQREIQSRVGFEKTFLEVLVLTGDIFAFYGLPEPQSIPSP